MNSKELRIGNWVTDGKNSNFQVQLIGLKNKFDPIPLTPKILIAAGFSLILIDGKKMWKIAPNDSFYLYGGNGFYCPNVMPEIEYVHQLQNLYFALTRTELTIKL